MKISNEARFGLLSLGTGLALGLARHVVSTKWAPLDWETFFGLWLIHWFAVFFVIFIVVYLDNLGRKYILELPPKEHKDWQTIQYWVCLTLLAVAFGMVFASVWPAGGDSDELGLF